ncbi:MAG: monovalent cation/H+ antiporter complex subunit F [Defluviitaleaceae bacterium]|nr:monovalent cation/H+ antiporter complex subunit F [Defluviitaleaceae bacterium]
MELVLWAMIIFLACYIVRVVKGPTIWDRLLGMNLISAKIIMIIIIFASMNNTGYLLDFAIIYSLFGFIGTIFIALFLSKQKLGRRRGKK